MKKFKKFVVGFMALALLVVSFTVTPLVAKADSSVMIYYQNTEGWENVYCYIWQGLGPVKGTATWPGTEMTKVEGTDNWYELEYTAGSAFQVIFNDNAVPKISQTGNLPSDLEADKSAYWFVPNNAMTDQGTSDGYTAQGLSVQILTEAPEGFPVSTSSTEGTQVKKADSVEVATEKDESPKTGDTLMPVVIVIVGSISLFGISLILLRKKFVHNN